MLHRCLSRAAGLIKRFVGRGWKLLGIITERITSGCVALGIRLCMIGQAMLQTLSGICLWGSRKLDLLIDRLKRSRIVHITPSE